MMKSFTIVFTWPLALLVLFATSPAAEENATNPSSLSISGTKLNAPHPTTSPPPKLSHPLVPVLEFATEGLEHICYDIHDYSCLLIKRERVDGRLSGYQHIRAKIRHQQLRDDKVTAPFSVYLKFLGPANLQGREVLYVRGQNEDDLIARRGGQRLAYMTFRLDPLGPIAMEGNRYPITEIGIENLIQRLIEVVKEDIRYDECEVKFFREAKLNGRQCTDIQVTHPVRRDHFRFHYARVLVDNELNVPIYYASYDWPEAGTQKPVLLEEYAYTEMKLNVGFTDEDFRRGNPEYGFSDPQEP